MPFVVWWMLFARASLIVLLLVLNVGAYAQQRTIPSQTALSRIAPSRVAFSGTYWFGSPLTFDRQAPSLLSFGSTIPGTSSDHSIGAVAELGFDIATDWTLLFQAGYRFGNGEFASSEFSTPPQEIAVHTDYRAVDLGLSASYTITPWLDVLGGGSLSFYPVSTAVQTRTTGISIDTVVNGGSLLGKPVHVFLPLGVRLTLLENNSYSIGLDLLASINITEALRGFTSASLRAGGGLWFALGSSLPDTHGIVDSIFIPIKPRLTASTRFFVNEQDADTIVVTTIDTVLTSSIVIPQYLYFDQGSDTLTSVTGVPDLSTMLTEIGKRLRENPTAELTLDLRRNTSEPASITAQRAAMLKRLIGSDRVTVTSAGKPVTEAGYVLLRTNDPLILAPIRTREIKRDQRVDHLSIDRSTIAEAGVANWSVVILNESDTLVSYGPAYARTQAEGDFSFSLPATASRLVLHAYVIDRAGQRIDSFDTLIVQSDAHKSREITIDEYTLAGQPKPPGQEWSFEQSLIDLIIRSVTPSTVVEISSLSPSGSNRLTEIARQLLDGCRARNILPKKIEVVPNGNASHLNAYSFRLNFDNIVVIRAVTE